jgi:DNA invertase Pin-like site-specific DNA recombinase
MGLHKNWSEDGSDTMRQVLSYIRVSTGKQGKSGLGIEAQREAISRFAAAEGLDVSAEYVEVETGKGADALDRRPRLAAALSAARKTKAEPVAQAWVTSDYLRSGRMGWHTTPV